MSNLYHISQDRYRGYGTYDSAVVVANTEAEAQAMSPSVYAGMSGWCSPQYVKVRYIGIANPGEQGVICASFNAG